MGVLLDKSNESFNSAKMLIDNGFHNSSIHCSYYSAFQTVLYILKNKLGYSDEFLENEAEKNKKNSHSHSIKIIHKELKDRNERFKALDFNKWILELKSKRHEADYKESILMDGESLDSYENAKKLNKLLTEIFLK